jgi:hypothetical protein
MCEKKENLEKREKTLRKVVLETSFRRAVLEKQFQKKLC